MLLSKRAQCLAGDFERSRWVGPVSSLEMRRLPACRPVLRCRIHEPEGDEPIERFIGAAQWRCEGGAEAALLRSLGTSSECWALYFERTHDHIAPGSQNLGMFECWYCGQLPQHLRVVLHPVKARPRKSFLVTMVTPCEAELRFPDRCLLWAHRVLVLLGRSSHFEMPGTRDWIFVSEGAQMSNHAVVSPQALLDRAACQATGSCSTRAEIGQEYS